MNIEWIRMLEDGDLWEVAMQEQDRANMKMKVRKNIKPAPKVCLA